MNTQHTPGPWTASDNAIYGSSGLIKPLIAYLDDRFADEEAANNARLIAAAPDLLAALQLCYEYLDCIPESAAGGDDEAGRLARIAKIVLNSI